MKTCLKTQLKSAVDNDGLVGLGVLRVMVKTMESFELATNGRVILIVEDGKTVHFKVNGIGLVYTDPAGVGTTEGDIVGTGANTYIYLSNGNYSVDFGNKYVIKRFDLSGSPHNIGFWIGDINYCPLQYASWLNTPVCGDISSIENLTSITTFNVSGSKITGSLYDLPNAPLTTIMASNCNVSGSLNAFQKFASTLTTLNVSSNPLINCNIAEAGPLTKVTLISLTNPYGTFESFVSGQVNAGSNPRATCTTGISTSNLLPTVSLGGKTYATEEGAQFITWDSESQIAVLAGGSSLAAATRVYCKGYTAEEAAAKWPGKTIIRVED